MAPEAVARGNENHCTALRPIGVETPSLPLINIPNRLPCDPPTPGRDRTFQPLIPPCRQIDLDHFRLRVERPPSHPGKW